MITGKWNIDMRPLDRLQDKLKKNTLKKAGRAVAKVVLNDAKAALPVVSGNLKKAFSSKVDAVKGTSNIFIIVGPQTKYKVTVKGKVRQPARQFHFLETGKHKKPVLIPLATRRNMTYIKIMEEVIQREMNAS